MGYNDLKWPIKSGQQFCGGLVDNTPPCTLTDWMSPFARNDRNKGFSSVKRRWRTLFTNTWGENIGGSIEFQWNLIVRANVDSSHKLVSIAQDGTVTNILTGSSISSDNPMTFTTAGEVLYCMNGVDLMWVYTNGTYRTQTITEPATTAHLSFGIPSVVGNFVFFNQNPIVYCVDINNTTKLTSSYWPITYAFSWSTYIGTTYNNLPIYVNPSSQMAPVTFYIEREAGSVNVSWLADWVFSYSSAPFINTLI